MSESDATHWTVIRAAAAGDAAARARFAQQYLPAVRAYFGARWRRSLLAGEVEDAAQEVFVECFREAGVLERADPLRGGFRALLYGVSRNVARRFESRRGRHVQKHESDPGELDRVVADEEGPSRAFDRAWATAVMRQAGARMLERAREAGPEALRRVELLRLRVVQDLPIREIAATWDADPTQVHRAYARARREFQAALREVVAGLQPGSREELDAECERLLAHYA